MLSEVEVEDVVIILFPFEGCNGDVVSFVSPFEGGKGDVFLLKLKKSVFLRRK